MDFKELKELYISNNGMSDINVLEKLDFKKLNTLYLNYNKISDINVLEKVDFKELKELYLKNNKILLYKGNKSIINNLKLKFINVYV